jgi:hypothetical protein
MNLYSNHYNTIYEQLIRTIISNHPGLNNGPAATYKLFLCGGCRKSSSTAKGSKEVAISCC